MKRRKSGILLHITSLPSPYGIGDLGHSAYRFADLLADSRQCLWQILPLNPTSTAYGNSPYSSYSAFAGNHILISPDLLMEDGLVLKSDLNAYMPSPNDRVDYESVTAFKENILRIACKNCLSGKGNSFEFERFCRGNAYWLDDYSLFVALKEEFHGIIWSDWPEDIRYRRDAAVREWKAKLQERIVLENFFQYVFFKQWSFLKRYCNEKNVQIIGDIPIYVIYDSADVWAGPEIFKLNDAKTPLSVAGVPPDYFSATGQLWGNPVYRWDALKDTGYSWWLKRMEHNLRLYDMVRLDHFRGFVAYWEVPANEKTAIHGKWVEAPAKDFFHTLFRHFPNPPIIAEDLGIITPDVREIMDIFELPGMKILLFAFTDDMPDNPYIPHNHKEHCVVYTGTHDNTTIKGWYRREAGPEEKKRICNYIGREISEGEIHREIIRLAMMSVANMVVIPMQDVLGLGEESRMNIPAIAGNNWAWRLLPEQLTPSLMEELAEMTVIYGRG